MILLTRRLCRRYSLVYQGSFFFFIWGVREESIVYKNLKNIIHFKRVFYKMDSMWDTAFVVDSYVFIFNSTAVSRVLACGGANQGLS